MKISNVKRLRRKIEALPFVAREEIDKALRQSAGEIVDLAKAFAPKKSGDLERSIAFTVGDYTPENSNVRGVSGSTGSHGLAVTIHAGDAKAFYAAWVEFGTAPFVNKGLYRGTHNPGMSAQPFFYPAYRLGKKRAKSRISRAVTKAAKKVAAAR